VPVIVCVGNPPYDLTEAADDANKARTGGWVRWGQDRKGTGAIFKDFLEPAVAAGEGVRVHHLYNLYVYFWRWALWKVLEQNSSGGPGVVSFISASSYLGGDAFCGMREHMRRLCDEIWILDLGGEARGARKSENVFAIQTPVAIAVAARHGTSDKNNPARVRYARLEGTREEKLKALDAISSFDSIKWEDCPDDWLAPFEPAGAGEYLNWPLLTDVFPWQQSGVKAGRKWVIAPEKDTLQRRWRVLCNADTSNRARLFKNSPTGHKVGDNTTQLPPSRSRLTALSEVPRNAPSPEIVRYAYRSLDRQYIFADARVLDRPGPPLWAAHGDGQVYLTSLLTKPLGSGPAVTASAAVPDLDHFSGRGAKDTVPLYRDPARQQPNLRPGLVKLLLSSAK